MSGQRTAPPLLARGTTIALGGAVLAILIWSAISGWTDIARVGAQAVGALWVLPATIALHLLQLRLVREGIDSLFPVAQMGGEVIGAHMLGRDGVAGGVAAASVVVDVTLEVVSQFAFLLITLVAVMRLVGTAHAAEWVWLPLITAAAGGALVAAQKLGALRLLEWLVQRIAEQFPALAAMSLSGLHGAARDIYRQRRVVLRAFLLHLLAWSLGTFETWAILAASGVSSASLCQALVIEGLGMAARSVGFAIPGALSVQEAGFALAASVVGLPPSAGLAVSLVKRAREVLVGIAGVTLARELGAWAGAKR